MIVAQIKEEIVRLKISQMYKHLEIKKMIMFKKEIHKIKLRNLILNQIRIRMVKKGMGRFHNIQERI